VRIADEFNLDLLLYMSTRYLDFKPNKTQEEV
jgi:hypothetical protein